MLNNLEKLEMLKEVEKLGVLLQKNKIMDIPDYCKMVKQELSERTVDFLLYTGLTTILKELEK